METSRPAPWLIHFFRRVNADDNKKAVPALDFFESLPIKVAAEIHAVLDAVAEAPPPAFSGGGKWEAMDPRDYRQIRQYRDEFQRHRTVLS